MAGLAAEGVVVAAAVRVSAVRRGAVPFFPLAVSSLSLALLPFSITVAFGFLRQALAEPLLIRGSGLIEGLGVGDAVGRGQKFLDAFAHVGVSESHGCREISEFRPEITAPDAFMQKRRGAVTGRGGRRMRGRLDLLAGARHEEHHLQIAEIERDMVPPEDELAAIVAESEHGLVVGIISDSITARRGFCVHLFSKRPLLSFQAREFFVALM